MLTAGYKDATRLALRRIRELRAKRQLPAEFKPGVPLVVAVEDEKAVDVIDRVTSYPAPVALAVYYPERHDVELLTLEPGPAGDAEVDRVKVGQDTTIGMMVDSDRAMSMPGQWNEIINAHRMAAAR